MNINEFKRAKEVLEERVEFQMAKYFKKLIGLEVQSRREAKS